jgi:hypothetical protein
MSRITRILCTAATALALSTSIASAQSYERAAGYKPDDRVMFDVSAEDWVTTKTAHVSVSVDAAVSASTEGTMRADMMKAVNDVAKGEWRLTAFNRNQDQTGLDHWNALFEARLPETALGGLTDAAKKLSKPGMQLMIANVDFSPTLEENEAVRSGLRVQIYKIANDQLTALNSAMPGRAYRIALVNFTGDEDDMAPMPRVMKGRAAMSMMATAAPMAEASPPPALSMERSQKVSLSARVVFASAPDAKSLLMPNPTPSPMAH